MLYISIILYFWDLVIIISKKDKVLCSVHCLQQPKFNQLSLSTMMLNTLSVTSLSSFLLNKREWEKISYFPTDYAQDQNDLIIRSMVV